MHRQPSIFQHIPKITIKMCGSLECPINLGLQIVLMRILSKCIMQNKRCCFEACLSRAWNKLHNQKLHLSHSNISCERASIHKTSHLQPPSLPLHLISRHSPPTLLLLPSYPRSSSSFHSPEQIPSAKSTISPQALNLATVNNT